MKIDLEKYILDYIGDISWYGETNHDIQSYDNMKKADEVLFFLEEMRERIQEDLFEHKNYRQGNASAEALHSKAFDVLKTHCINNSYSELCEIWKD